VSATGGLNLDSKLPSTNGNSDSRRCASRESAHRSFPPKSSATTGNACCIGEIDDKIDQPFVLRECWEATRWSCSASSPHERSFAFNVAFALSLSVIKIAGRTAGLPARRDSTSAGGAERPDCREDGRASRFQVRTDPRGILNPGKVTGGGGLLDVVMGGAAAFEGLVRPIANAAKPPAGPGDLSAAIRGIPGDVAFMAYACARCGYCVHTCEQYSGRGWESHSPRGKYAYLREVLAGREAWDRTAIDTFLVCTTCEVCNTRCQLQLPVERNWMEMRGKLINE
jgi:hypothetical protein